MAIEYNKYLRASNGDGPAATAFLSDDREVGDMSVITDNVHNWPQYFVATVGDLMPDNTVGVTSVFLGHLEGSIVMIDEFAPGYFDEPYHEGQTIFIKPASMWADIIADTTENVAQSVTDMQAEVTDMQAEVDTIPDKVNASLLPIHTDEANGRVGIGKIPGDGALDVDGDIYANNEQVLTSNVINHARGRTVRHSDGTQIFTSVKQPELTTNQGHGNVWASDTQTLVYPVPFIEEPAVSVSAYWAANRPWVGLIENRSGTECGYRIMGSTNAARGRAVVTAIGRWK